MDIRYIGIRLGSARAGAGTGPLTAIVRDENGTQFTVSNLVYNQTTVPFTVAAAVKDEAGTDFTIFT